MFVLHSRGTRTDEQQPTPPGALLSILESFFNSEKKTSAYSSSETGRLHLTANNVEGGEREQSGQKGACKPGGPVVCRSQPIQILSDSHRFSLCGLSEPRTR